MGQRLGLDAWYWLSLVLWFGLCSQASALPLDIRANGYAVEASTTSVFVLPNESVTIEFIPRNLDDSLQVRSDTGAVIALGENRWLYQPADVPVADVTLRTQKQSMRLRVFQLTPFNAANSSLNGFTIGNYPSAKGGNQRLDYAPPVGLIAAAPALLRERVSTHFTLGQFVQRTTDDTTYLALSTRLLETLEHLMQTLQNRGWQGKTLNILSGYRTPLHNQRVGGARYSRHIYGDAVDLIPDADGDGAMDDLNEDGRSDREDVEWLIAMLLRQAIPATMGGAGSYETAGQAGAFLHLDTRGRPADWQR